MYQVVGISQRSWGQIRQVHITSRLDTCLSHTATCNTPISVAKAVATKSCAHRRTGYTDPGILQLYVATVSWTRISHR